MKSLIDACRAILTYGPTNEDTLLEEAHQPLDEAGHSKGELKIGLSQLAAKIGKNHPRYIKAAKTQPRLGKAEVGDYNAAVGDKHPGLKHVHSASPKKMMQASAESQRLSLTAKGSTKTPKSEMQSKHRAKSASLAKSSDKLKDALHGNKYSKAAAKASELLAKKAAGGGKRSTRSAGVSSGHVTKKAKAPIGVRPGKGTKMLKAAGAANLPVTPVAPRKPKTLSLPTTKNAVSATAPVPAVHPHNFGPNPATVPTTGTHHLNRPEDHLVANAPKGVRAVPPQLKKLISHPHTVINARGERNPIRKNRMFGVPIKHGATKQGAEEIKAKKQENLKSLANKLANKRAAPVAAESTDIISLYATELKRRLGI